MIFYRRPQLKKNWLLTLDTVKIWMSNYTNVFVPHTAIYHFLCSVKTSLRCGLGPTTGRAMRRIRGITASLYLPFTTWPRYSGIFSVLKLPWALSVKDTVQLYNCFVWLFMDRPIVKPSSVSQHSPPPPLPPLPPTSPPQYSICWISPFPLFLLTRICLWEITGSKYWIRFSRKKMHFLWIFFL